MLKMILRFCPEHTIYLLDVGVKDKVSLIAGGGLRSSADFARAVGKDDIKTVLAFTVAKPCEEVLEGFSSV